MRHHDRNKKFGRVKRGRIALMRNLARSLILSEEITTTTAKAKALRPFVERLITKSRKGGLAATRATLAQLGGARDAERKLRELAQRFEKRPGGYTRITRVGRVGKRVGDMARIEFVEKKGDTAAAEKETATTQ